MTEDTDTHSDTGSTDDKPTVSRRDALAAIAGVAVGGAGAATVAQSGAADPDGKIDVGAAYLQEIRGPIVDQGSAITELTDIRVAEDGASISPDPDTLIVRYDPNSTV